MKRNLKKYVEEYQRDFYPTGGVVYLDDIQQICDMVQDSPHNDAVLDLIYYAFAAGYVAGHRRGVKDTRKKVKKIVKQCG